MYTLVEIEETLKFFSLMINKRNKRLACDPLLAIGNTEIFLVVESFPQAVWAGELVI